MRFDTLLIANRGEIALRILRTARSLGLRTVAVYSDADADARHVREADLAVHIGPSAAQSSYRNIDAILQACADSGAQAVHPGYGFLSENADFARAVTAAGLVFVGPGADVVALMGNKARAKEAMQRADVPTVPGVQGVTGERELAAHARSVGYPVILKAAAGGGGRGMRLAHDAAGLLEALPLARSEAMGAFGSDELILEKAILSARHVEIQVLCDEHGHCIHLGERDCSLQRRYQKMVEECPSPAVSPALRERMGAVAVRACQSIGYVGAGTLEFLLAGDDFYFMEMNTRLQVEHGVTELVTGLDLVEWQLRVAQGEPLTLQQADIRFRGHAMELRVCAEDPAAGFVPQVGTVTAWREPADIRVDSAIESGMEVSPFYDSMLAKYLAWAPTRDACIGKLTLACERTTLLGIRSNLDFLCRAINHPAFREGGVTTTFLGAEDVSAGYWRSKPGPYADAAAALALGGLADSPAGAASGLMADAELVLQGERDGDMRLVRIARTAEGSFRIRAWAGEAADGDASCTQVAVARRVPGELSLVIGGVRRKLRIGMPDADTVWVQDGAGAWVYRRATRFGPRAGIEAGGVASVRAPVSGRVISLVVDAGTAVKAQQAVLVLESMKLEMPIPAGVNGSVTKVHVAPGDQVSTGQVLIEVER